MTAVGRIQEIARYPVKSFAGERLNECRIEPYGLYGDRWHAFIDETKEGWDSYVTARTIPDMLGYKASLAGVGASGDDADESLARMRVSVTSPDGRSFGWDKALLEEMQKRTSVRLSMASYPLQDGGLMAVDEASVLIVTDASLRRLEGIWGKRPDPRRFRANLLVALDESAADESRWLGKRLSAGAAELRVDLYCERCSMITLDPDTMERDSSLLRQINERMGLNFGVYASVLKPGPVRVGDPVILMD